MAASNHVQSCKLFENLQRLRMVLNHPHLREKDIHCAKNDRIYDMIELEFSNGPNEYTDWGLYLPIRSFVNSFS